VSAYAAYAGVNDTAFTQQHQPFITESNMETSYQESKNQLMNDFNTAVADAEELLSATMDVGGEKVATIRAKAEESLNIAKARMAEAQTALLTKTKEAAKATDAYVHENPWRSVGFAASIGVVIGLLIGRR
jgi:ElaB/YqjD/DUF883 family membrane-anchored ribosome-binding protein